LFSPIDHQNRCIRRCGGLGCARVRPLQKWPSLSTVASESSNSSCIGGCRYRGQKEDFSGSRSLLFLPLKARMERNLTSGKLLGVCLSVSFVLTAASTCHATTYSTTILNPSGFFGSTGRGVSGDSQVGDGLVLGVQINNEHALLWSGSAASAVDLNPAGFTDSYALGVSGDSQVGFGFGPATGNNTHALLWSGSAASAIDLNPAGITSSGASGVSGNSQVGDGFSVTGNFEHAFLWSGSAASAVDLNPAGFTDSRALGVSGNSQVGHGTTRGRDHALLWTGTASSAVDLNPAGFTTSEATGVSGNSQVGDGTTLGRDHALLWTGTASSAVDLNPAGFTSSKAWGVSGNSQVGGGYGPNAGNNEHALLWNGSASSFLDLHKFLPSGFSSSEARGIDSTTGGIVGEAQTEVNGTVTLYAVLWIPTPEPNTFVLAGIAGAAALPFLRGRLCRRRCIKHWQTMQRPQSSPICPP
jgi:hypothetical protein